MYNNLDRVHINEIINFVSKSNKCLASLMFDLFTPLINKFNITWAFV